MAQWKSLGLVTVATAGAPVRATANISSAAPFGQSSQMYFCMAILFQAAPANGGKMYVGDNPTFSKGGAGQLAIIGVPTTNVIPSAGVNVPNAPNGLNAGDYYIDADTNGNSVSVSVLIS